jgi:hypothetical protein
LILGSRRWPVFTREPLGHFFLLPLFTLLFFLALFKGLRSATWHALLL